jgi:glutathione S-transferase
VEATKEAQEILRIIEEHGLGEKKFFGGNNMGMADIAFGAFLCYFLFQPILLLGA